MIKQALQKISGVLFQHENSKLQGMHLLKPEAENDYTQGTYFEQLAIQRHQDFLIHHAIESEDQSPIDYRNAMWNFLSAALKGHKDAQYRIGVGYLNGELGLDRNYSHAQAWLNKAAAQGHSSALHALNQAYEELTF